MLYITLETHAPHYTGNTCTTSHRNHTHNITQETNALNYTEKHVHYIAYKPHAPYYTGNTCTTSHRKHTHYITQKASHVLHYNGNT